MSKPQQRDRSTLTIDHYKELIEACSTLIEMLTQCDILVKEAEAS